jgi:hypothetical protein
MDAGARADGRPERLADLWRTAPACKSFKSALLAAPKIAAGFLHNAAPKLLRNAAALSAAKT